MLKYEVGLPKKYSLCHGLTSSLNPFSERIVSTDSPKPVLKTRSAPSLTTVRANVIKLESTTALQKQAILQIAYTIPNLVQEQIVWEKSVQNRPSRKRRENKTDKH